MPNDYTTDGGGVVKHRVKITIYALETNTLTITPPMGVEPTIYRTLDEHGNDYTTDWGLNPRSTALETSTLTITLPMGGQTHDLPHSGRAR